MEFKIFSDVHNKAWYFLMDPVQKQTFGSWVSFVFNQYYKTSFPDFINSKLLKEKFETYIIDACCKIITNWGSESKDFFELDEWFDSTNITQIQKFQKCESVKIPCWLKPHVEKCIEKVKVIQELYKNEGELDEFMHYVRQTRP